MRRAAQLPIALAFASGCWLFLPLNDTDGGADAAGDAGADVACPTPGSFCGCEMDNPTGTRDLPTLAIQSDGGSTPAISVEICVAACAGKGCMFAGLQDGRQCFCGAAFGAYGPSSSCTFACPSNAAEMCGGLGANDVYRALLEAGACD